MADETRSPEKPTDQWVTGDEPMTGPQASYLQTLAREAGEDVPDGLTKAQASEMIDRLQAKTGRGADSSGGGSGGGTSGGVGARAERAGVVDQQGALLDQIDSGAGSGAQAAGSSTAEREGIVDQQDAVLEQMDQGDSSVDRTS